MSVRFRAALSAAVLVVTPLAVASVASPADAAQGRKFANCTALARVYPHGVAKSSAAADRQVAEGYGRPSTTARAKAAYQRNYRSMDRDRDGTACER